MGGSYDAGVTPSALLPGSERVVRDHARMRARGVVDRRHSGTWRIVVAAVAGVAAAAVASWFAPWQLTILLAWDVAAVVAILRAWSHVWHFTSADTRAYATVEDTTRGIADTVLLAASTVSLVGVAVAFLKANGGSTDEEVLIKAIGVVTILVSWLVVHTILAFKYAHQYYGDPVGGINFKSVDRDPDPDYRDFAYLAFTVGMTYQVADTDVTLRAMRRLVLRHALLSFVFGSVILATTVNLIADLLNS
jgi:uncharacterized membrane protein